MVRITESRIGGFHVFLNSRRADSTDLAWIRSLTDIGSMFIISEQWLNRHSIPYWTGLQQAREIMEAGDTIQSAATYTSAHLPGTGTG